MDLLKETQKEKQRVASKGSFRADLSSDQFIRLQLVYCFHQHLKYTCV